MSKLILIICGYWGQNFLKSILKLKYQLDILAVVILGQNLTPCPFLRPRGKGEGYYEFFSTGHPSMQKYHQTYH